MNIVLLLLAIPSDLFGGFYKKLIKTGCAFGGGICFYKLVNLTNKYSLINVVANSNRPIATLGEIESNINNAYYSLSIIYSQPLEYFKIMFRTLKTQSWSYILQANGLRLAGWTVIIDDYLIIIYISLLILVSVSKCVDDQNSLKVIEQRIFIIVAIIEFMTVTTAGFLMTTYGKSTLGGLQGRYYIPCLIMFLIGIKNIPNCIYAEKKWHIFLICCIYIGIVFSVMYQIVYR